jgi:DNA-binding PadR family transcriptional regulator
MRDPRKKGLLRLFILRTLSVEAKSGYDILKEIEEKTSGEWRPSKGTVYPILTELEGQGFLEGVEEGARARKALKTTKAGLEHLADSVRRHRVEHRRRMAGRRILFEETFFDEAERRVLKLSDKFVRRALNRESKAKAIRILEEALSRLEEDA